MPNRPFDDPLLRDSDDLRCLMFPGVDDLLDHEVGPRAFAEKVRLWGEVTLLIERARRVVFIGYSLPRYDSEARSILEKACRSKVVIVCNPARDVIWEFRRVFQQSEVVAEPNKFEESTFGAISREGVSA